MKHQTDLDAQRPEDAVVALVWSQCEHCCKTGRHGYIVWLCRTEEFVCMTCGDAYSDKKGIIRTGIV